MSAETPKRRAQINQIWKIALLVILVPVLVAAFWKMSSWGGSTGGGAEGSLGERITTKLSKDLNRTGQKLEFEPHLVSVWDYNLEEGWIEIGIGCFFKNVGSEDLHLSLRDDVRVEDRTGRRYSLEWRHSISDWSATIGPGLEERRLLRFKLPKDSFIGDLYLGFPKKGDGDGKMLAKMKIYDARSSNFAIGDGGSFYTEEWDVDN